MTTSVHAGADLQAALNAAQPGDTLELDSGATFLGNFTLPIKPDAAHIIVRGTAALRTPNSLPALRTIGNTAHWRLENVTFTAGASGGPIVQLGDGVIATVTGLPRDVTFDFCSFIAEQTAKNGIELNASDVVLRHCMVRGVKVLGQETHALTAWNSPGPFLIEDCILEAGSCGAFFGGAKAAIPDCVPSDLTFRRNLTTRPLELRAQSGWGIKNLFELKNMRRAIITGNIFQHNWPDSQSGWSIVFTVRANALDAQWTTIEDVLFQDNIVRDVCMGFNVLGLDNQRIPAGTGPICPSTRMRNVTIQNNLVLVDRWAWMGPTGQLGNGVMLQVDEAPINLHVTNNTLLGNGNILNLVGPVMSGFRFEHNITQKTRPINPATGNPVDTYGIYGNGVGEGNPAVATFCPDAVIAGNVLAGCTPSAYSSRPNNAFPTVAALTADLVNPEMGNYRLKSTSVFLGSGCNQDDIELAQAPPLPPAPPTLQELIQGIVDDAHATADEIDGSVSPREAAHVAIDELHTAILEVLP